MPEPTSTAAAAVTLAAAGASIPVLTAFGVPLGLRSVWGGLIRSAPGQGVGLVRCMVGVALPHSAPEQGVSRPPHTASRDCRNGSPLARAIPCAPAPECGVTRETEQAGQRCNEEPKSPCIAACVPTRSAASRDGMAGWAGEGGGRFGERREYEAPTLPSTPRQHGMARHHTRQPRNVCTTRLGSQPQRPAEKQHATTQARQETAPHRTLQPRSPTGSCKTLAWSK